VNPKACLALAALATVVIACSGPNDFAGSPLTVRVGGWNGDLAALEGRLVEEDGCVIVVAEDSRRILITFAREGLEWDEAGATAGVYGHEYRIGDQVRIGGSFWPDPEATAADDGWIYPPSPGCRYDAMWGLNPPQPDRP
jgi:hypothetical protein